MATSSSGLEKRSHPIKGNALYATRAFPAGSPIACFTSSILLPQTSFLSNLCAYCLRQPPSGEVPKACTRCRSAFYCDASCQTPHWQAVHSKECKPLAKLREQEGEERQLPTLVRAALQAVVKEDIGKGMDGLESHLEKWMGSGRWEGRGMGVAARALVMYAGKKDLTVEKAAEVLTKIQTNAFYRYDPDWGQFGIFFEPNLAMANHSCIPNAFVQFIGRDALLRAEKPIAAGEEIEISYTDNMQPRAVRHGQLEDYFFDCRCKRCAEDLNIYHVCAMYPDLELNKESVTPDLANVKQHPAVTGGDAVRQKIQRFASRSEPQKAHFHELMGDGFWALPGVAEYLSTEIVANIEGGNISQALTLACIQATHSDPYRYPAPFHPVRVKNLLVVAKLLSNTAAATAGLNSSISTLAAQYGNLEQKIQDGLGDIDQVSLCQMILMLILRWAPKGREAQWEVSAMAKAMLEDIDQLPGREKELSLINAWKAAPLSDSSQAFFDFAVVKPVRALAEIGKGFLELDKTPDPS